MDKKSQRYFPNIKKIFKIKSIRGKFFLTIAICIIIPLSIVGIIASLLSSTTLFRSAILNNQNFLKNLISVVDTNVMDMDRLSKVTYSDTRVQTILAKQGNYQNLREQLENSLQMDQLFQNLITIRENITGIYIFNLNGLLYEHFSENNSFNNDYNYKKEPWFANGVKANGGIVITGAHKPEYLNFFDQNKGSWQDQYVYSVFRQINSFSPHKALGYILIDQPLRTIDDIIKRMNLSGAKTIIIDENGNIVYEPSGGLINKNFLVLSQSLQPIQNSDNGYFYIRINRDKYLVTYQKSNYSNWKFISLIPYKVIMHDSVFLTNATSIIGLICLLVSLIIASFIAYRITKPIKILLSGMKRVGKGNFEILIEVGSEDEMEEISDGFNGMTKKIKNLIQSEYEAEIKQKESEVHQREAELNSLRNQINPHFLYNTLESIRTLAALNGDKDVAEMTYSLANLFRMSMSRGEKYVVLSHEVELINHYTYIQRIRFDNKFTVQYDIPSGII